MLKRAEASVEINVFTCPTQEQHLDIDRSVSVGASAQVCAAQHYDIGDHDHVCNVLCLDPWDTGLHVIMTPGHCPCHNNDNTNCNHTVID